ncbi:hypothetical protein [Marinilabilia sp.]|uniref:hypothetical protein n=1 Tax=Marinilabilia sp. TaxID=2021252 RepID=UPI0025C72C76|nr:hypothetical protein [Marinilabilia sp.]
MNFPEEREKVRRRLKAEEGNVQRAWGLLNLPKGDFVHGVMRMGHEAQGIDWSLNVQKRN